MKIVNSLSVVALSMFLGAGMTLAQQAPAPAKQPSGGQSGGSNAPRATAPASADDNSTYKAKTVYDFEDDMVEGDLQRPDGELIDSVRKVKHSSLIEIRKDFIPEMLKSLEDL
jgi:hypothetical protein